MTNGDHHHLTTAQTTALTLAARRIATAGRQDSPEYAAALDALLLLVGEQLDVAVTEARDMFRLEALAAVESLAPVAAVA